VRYPECKFIKQKVKELDVACPKCGAPVIVKRGKKSTFYSCSKYPECDFSSWDMPVNEKCPECGGQLFRKKGKEQLVCHTEGCGFKKDIAKEN
jgi:DNA topoisomerase-1